MDTTDKKSKSLGATLSKIGGGELLVAGAALAAVGGASIKAGSDLNESLSKVNVVFGDGAKVVDDWSQHAATGLGLSRQAALEAAGTFGNFLISMGETQAQAQKMSLSLVQLSSDLASFNNTSPEDALLAIRAGLAGEVEPLRRYGVSLSAARIQNKALTQGITQNYNEMSAATKATLAYAIILEDTKLAQGDFARTAGGLANQQRIITAQTKDLEAQIGGVLVPALLSAEKATFGVARGLQSANDATGGFLGKATLIGAAVPVAVFAVEKLGKAGIAIGGQFAKAGSAVGGALRLVGDVGAKTGTIISDVGTAAERFALQQANVTLATAAMSDVTNASAVANARLDAAIAAQVVAEKGDVEAAREVTVAHAAATRALERQIVAADALAAAEGRLAVAQAAEAGGAGAQLGVGAGAATTGAAASLGLVAGAVAIPLAGLAAGILIVRQAAAKADEIKQFAADLQKTGDAARHAQVELSKIVTPDLPAGKLGKDLQAYSDALLSASDKAALSAAAATLNGDALEQEKIKFFGAGKAAHVSADEVEFFRKHNSEFSDGLAKISANIDIAKSKLESLTKEYGAGAIQSAELAGAQKQLRDDLTVVATGADKSGAAARRLGADRAAVGAASRIVAGVEKEVQAATNGTTGALNANATAADKGKFAYLGLANSVTTAGDAFREIQKHAFLKFDAEIAVNQDKTSVQSALEALNNPDVGSGGGGGGGQSATAKALEAAQKNLTLRDSLLGVKQATQNVKDAERTLAQSHRDAADAADAVKDAQENLRTTLKGVARDSDEARAAIDSFAAAQNAAAGSKLDVSESKRALAQAKLDAQSRRFAVEDAQTTLSNSIADEADPEQIAKDTLALKSARIDASGSADAVKRAELALSDAQLGAKQKTNDLTEAQRQMNGTLHGFKPTSDEAKTAQDQLTQAQIQARSATDAVRQAQEGLRTATNATADAALGLIRAQADLDGKLESSSGAAAAGKKLDSLTTRIDNARTAIKQFAQDAFNADILAGKAFGQSILKEIQTLEAFAAANPLLAHAFDSALKELEQKFAADLIHRGLGQSGFKVKGSKIVRSAGGGHLDAGQPSFVGEQGIELFVPDVSGTIVPNHSLQNSKPVTGAFGGDTFIINASTIEEHRLGTVVVRALEGVTARNGSLPRTIRTAS